MRARHFARGLAAAVVLFVAPSIAPARAGDGTETLRTLYRVALSAEMCGFPMAQKQSEALGQSMNRALTESGLDEEAADAVYREVDAALEAEGWDKVCATNGDWARHYRALLAANTK